MSKQEHNEEIPENTITYVYMPDEGIYGTILRQGAWASLIQYYENGIEYNIEVANDEYIVVDEIGIGYIEETDNDL